MRKIIVICTSLVSLILTSHPVLAEQLRVDEFTTEGQSGLDLYKLRNDKFIFQEECGGYAKMKINGKKILLNRLDNSSYKKYNFLSQDQKIKVQIDFIKYHRNINSDIEPIDRAILTVKKGKNQIKLNVKGYFSLCG